MEKPNITKETTETLLETKFLKVFDLQYAPGKHYFDATRQRVYFLAIKLDILASCRYNETRLINEV